MIKMKRATQLTLFSTALLATTTLALSLMLIADINVDIQYQGIRLLIFVLVTAVLAYTASAVIIDKTLNPIKIMITKIHEVKNMDFSKPLVINEEDEELKEYVFAFNAMAQNLNSYIERQKRFISDASHELATPITVINGYADLLLRRGKQNPELIDNGLEVIKSEILRMDRLVDSLLLLARSDSGKQSYTFERIDMGKLLMESIKEAKVIAPDFNFETNIEENLYIRCDEYSIQRVMRIILSNAVRYSGEACNIQIKASLSHGLVRISIRDNGIGIAPEHLPRIFERFYRVDASRSNKTGSSGLGLAIASELINAHGGDIQAVSTLGEGTEFCILLPS